MNTKDELASKIKKNEYLDALRPVSQKTKDILHSPAKIISGSAKSTIKTYEIRYFSKSFFTHFLVDNCQ